MNISIKKPSTTRLIEKGKEWLENSPPAQPGPAGLIGFTGPAGFVCQPCASRIMGRGCNFKRLADFPVWDDMPESVESQYFREHGPYRCVLCTV